MAAELNATGLASSATRGLQNLRDLGGLPTGGGQIASRILYRSDAPRRGDETPRGIRWPPASVIDLRAGNEATGQHPLAEFGSEVFSISLIAEASIVNIAERPDVTQIRLGELYRRTLGSAGPAFARIAGIAASAPDPILVHCTAGKDRTGLVVATILAALGVPREEIIRDYVRTQANMPGVLARIASTPGLEDGERLVQRIALEQPEILNAPAAAIAFALDLLDQQDGAEAWLLGNGLSQDELEQLRFRLVNEYRAFPG
jgi:protein-tyrosine phosphatase